MISMPIFQQRKEKCRMDSAEFQSDLTVRPEVLGSPALLTRFLQNTSSQRSLMSANALPQAEILYGCECARIQTGFETKYGRYQFDVSTRDQDIQIVEVIPKFKVNIRNDQIRNNPTLTVVYIGADDGRIGYFDVNSYTELHSGFGYMNKKMNQFQLTAGNFVSKDTKFISAPNHEDEIYKLGTMVNCCYIPMWDTTDDAFVISRSLAKKMEHSVVDSIIINIKPDSIPLNLYGDDLDYKCFPDIGSTVRDDGIIMAFRQKNESSFLTDITAKALYSSEFLHDDTYEAPPGAEIIDVQIFTNQKVYPNLNESPYTQLMQYQDQHHEYYAAIVDVYEKLKKEGYKCRPEFANLVTKCKGWCYYRGGKNMILMDKKEPIEFVRIKLTYITTQGINRGSKISGIEGSKGVVSDIWEDEDMPVGPHGIRADILVTAESPFNRLNSGQLNEQFLTLCMDVVTERVKKGVIPEDKAFDYVLEFINDVRPVYAKHIREIINTKDLEEEFVDAVKSDGIYMIIPSFCNNITPELYLYLSKKYGVDHGPFTYYRRNPDGTREKIVTKCKGIIGGRYMYLLGKRPIDQLNVVEFGYVNQFMAPIKPNSRSTKAQCLFGQTPMRYGEDEIANTTSVFGAETVARLTGEYSNSPTALNKLMTCLLTDEHPSALKNIGMTTKEIIETSSNIAMFKHMFAEIGFAIKEVEATMDENGNIIETRSLS